MASGLAAAKWNNADITEPDFDRTALLDWYARRDVPWGIRVPVEIAVDLGEPLFQKRAAGLVATAFHPTDSSAVVIRRADAADLPDYGAVELGRFGGNSDLVRRWLEPAIGAPDFNHWIAFADGAAVGVAMTIFTNDLAGPAAYLAGVASVPAWSNCGLEAALASAAISAAFDSGATVVHTNPDEGEREWVAQLGFVEVPGFLVRIVRAK